MERVAAVEKLTDKVAVELQDELVKKAAELGEEIEKARLHTAECARAIGDVKAGIDMVKDRVAAHDKVEARVDEMREQVGGDVERSTKQVQQMQTTVDAFVRKSEAELETVGSLTRRIIASSSTADLDKILSEANLSIMVRKRRPPLAHLDLRF